MIFKRIISFTLILSISASMFTLSANAIENGVDAPKEGRTVALSSASIGKFCTGFMYSERIILTTGHCLFNGNSGTMHTDVYSDYPDATYSRQSKKIKIEKSFLADDWSKDEENNFNPKGEFAIFILSQSVPITGKTIIASPDKIQEYLISNKLISNVGYGRQSPDHGYDGLTSPKYAVWPLVAIETVNNELEKLWKYLGKRKTYNMKIHVLQVPGGPSTCSGDSGSPFYVKEGNDFIYLGPLSNGYGGFPNCSGKPWPDTFFYAGSTAAYDYIYLIKRAEDYVKSNPVKGIGASAINITCTKGKTTKKVSGVNPKCPVGYKKK